MGYGSLLDINIPKSETDTVAQYYGIVNNVVILYI